MKDCGNYQQVHRANDGHWEIEEDTAAFGGQKGAKAITNMLWALVSAIICYGPWWEINHIEHANPTTLAKTAKQQVHQVTPAITTNLKAK